jgi:predicted amidophosphoribosyltransferase
MSLDTYLYLTDRCEVCNAPTTSNETLCPDCAAYLDSDTPSDYTYDQE